MRILISLLASKRFRDLMLIVSALAALVVTGLIVDLNKSEWAAWVQAVGAIAAIFVAFRVANDEGMRQRRSERRSAAEERKRLAHFASGAIAHALYVMRGVRRTLQTWPDGSGYVHHAEGVLEAAIQVVRILMAHTLSAELTSIVLNVHSTLLEVDAAAKLIEGQGPSHYKSNTKFEQFWDGVEQKMAEIELRTGIVVAAADMDHDLLLPP